MYSATLLRELEEHSEQKDIVAQLTTVMNVMFALKAMITTTNGSVNVLEQKHQSYIQYIFF